MRIAFQGFAEPTADGIASYGAPGGFNGLEHFLIFHAALTVYEPDGTLVPRLAEKIPSLQDGDWRTFPDGRMEVTWKLRPEAQWHDGTPLTSEDFAFGLRVISDADIPISRSTWTRLVTQFDTPDPHTLVMHWRETSFEAGGNGATYLNPLPSHLLSGLHQAGDKQAFLNSPYWTTEFIGLGPYRLTRWERGSFIEGLAFDGFVHGRPKIDRVLLNYVGDSNVVVAGMIAGDQDVVPMGARLDVEQMMAVRSGWRADAGFTSVVPFGVRTVYLQFRDASVPWARDVRVRRALAHATDKQGMSDALQYGLTPPADTFVPLEDAAFHVLVERGFARYPFDSRRALELLGEASWTPGGDGIVHDGAGQALALDLSATRQGSNVEEIVVLASQWRSTGVRANPVPLPPQAANLDELKATVRGGFVWPGLSLGSPSNLTTDRIPTERTAWRGSNYGSYSNPAYDQLYSQFLATLDLPARQRVQAELMALVAEEVPVIPIYYYGNVVMARKGVEGPGMITPLQTASTWNLHSWQLR